MARTVAEAARLRASRVAVIHVALGAGAPLGAEALVLALRAAAQGTAAADAEVRLRRVAGEDIVLESLEVWEE
jgi:Zn finger protein HypA/HybF involved in hydrogenase expression